MRSIRQLVESVRGDLDEHDQAAAALGTEKSDYVEISRRDVEALLAIAARHDECRPWVPVTAEALKAMAERRAEARGV